MIGLSQNISANILSDPHYFLDWPDCEKKNKAKYIQSWEKSNIYKTKIFYEKLFALRIQCLSAPFRHVMLRKTCIGGKSTGNGFVSYRD